jgi:hypothetical protein
MRSEVIRRKLERRSRRVSPANTSLGSLTKLTSATHGELALCCAGKPVQQPAATVAPRIAEGGLAGLDKSAPGPKARLTAEQKEIERLKLQNQRLQKKLAVAEGCLELQKKALWMLDHLNNESS